MEFDDILIKVFHFCDLPSLLILKMVSPHYCHLLENYILKNWEPHTLPIHLGRFILTQNNDPDVSLTDKDEHFVISPSVRLSLNNNKWVLALKNTRQISISDPITTKTTLDHLVKITDRYEKDCYYYMETHHNSLICLFTFQQTQVSVKWDVTINKSFLFATKVLGWNLPLWLESTDCWLFQNYAIFTKFENDCLLVLKINQNGHIFDNIRIKLNISSFYYKIIRELQNHDNSPCFWMNSLKQHCIFFHKTGKLWQLNSNRSLFIVRSPTHGTFDMCAFVFYDDEYSLFWIDHQGYLYASVLSRRKRHETELYIVDNHTLYSKTSGTFLEFQPFVRTQFSLNYYGLSLYIISNN